MNRSVAAPLRIIAVALLGFVVPACGRSQSSPPPGPALLFSEDFDEFPNPAWAVSGSGSFAVDETTGTPSPSLSTAPHGPSNASLSFDMVSPVGGTDLTFSADMLFSASGPGGGAGSIAILGAGTGATVAAADLDAGSGVLTISIGAVASPPLAISPGWHAYQFSFDAAGNASWFLDGTLELTVLGFVPPAAMILSLENASGSVFNFDTVRITSP